MTDLRQVYRHIVAEGRCRGEDVPYVVVAELPAASVAERVVDAAEQLEAVFDQFAGVMSTVVFVGGTEVGTALREDYPAATASAQAPTAAHGSRVGEGDGAVLPGHSRHYEAFHYNCPQCGQDVYTTASQAPSCPRCQVSTTAAS